MKVLGIDTASRAGSLALVDGDRLIGSVNVRSHRTHSIRLLPALDGLLRQAEMDLRALDGIAVCTGPGSFTGIRIGLATAKALCFALGCGIAGVSALEALAASAALLGGTLVPLLDAGREEFYRAVFRVDANHSLVPVGRQRLVSLSQAAAEQVPPAAVFLGEAAARHRQALLAMAPPGCRVERMRPFLAEEVARLAQAVGAAGRWEDPAALDGNYIRKSDAELKAGA